jgi:glycosyltransferase involved in cell wall biosynthesis
MQIPRLSVVMPNYNDAAYLPEALDAVLSQSLRPHEVIVVDDGSTDASLEILRGYAARDPLVRVVRNERNLGCAGAIRRGIALATGDFIYQPASNDRIHPGFFEKAMTLLARHPHAGLFLADYESMDGQRYAFHLSEAPCYFPPDAFAALCRRIGYFPASGATTILRRDDVLRAGSVRLELRGLYDVHLALMLAVRTGLCYLPESVMSVRRMAGSYGQQLWKWRVQRVVGRRFFEIFDAPDAADLRDWIRRTGVWPPLQPYLISQLLLDRRRWPYLSARVLQRALWQTAVCLVAPYAPLGLKRFVSRLRDRRRRGLK